MNVTDLVAAGMAAALDQEARDKLMKEAMAHVITRPRNSYGTESKSPVENAFANAVELAVREIVKEEISKPERQEEIRNAVIAAWGKFFQHETMADAMSNAAWRALTHSTER